MFLSSQTVTKLKFQGLSKTSRSGTRTQPGGLRTHVSPLYPLLVAIKFQGCRIEQTLRRFERSGLNVKHRSVLRLTNVLFMLTEMARMPRMTRKPCEPGKQEIPYPIEIRNVRERKGKVREAESWSMRFVDIKFKGCSSSIQAPKRFSRRIFSLLCVACLSSQTVTKLKFQGLSKTSRSGTRTQPGGLRTHVPPPPPPPPSTPFL